MKLIVTAKAKSKNSKIKSLNKKKMKQYYNVLFPENYVNTLTASKITIVNKINEIINNISSLPDSDNSEDLFEDKNNKSICFHFFNDIKNALPDNKLETLLSKYNLNENYFTLYRKLNDPKSPVRNYLIIRNLP